MDTAGRYKMKPGMSRRLAVAALLLALPLSARTQGQMANMGSFDRDLLHYGIQVGYTQSKFDLHFSDDEQLRQTLQGVTSYYERGFHIGIVGDLRLGKWFNLRAVPGVTLVTRNVSYSWEEEYLANHHSLERARTVESVYGDLPIEIKYRAVRYGNFRPYVTAGVSYGFDLASLRKNRNLTNQAIIRLDPNDLRYTAGIGFDFFLLHVKFAIEMKMCFGVLDLKVDDPDIYVRSFDYLRTRTFMLSFTFEG